MATTYTTPPVIRPSQVRQGANGDNTDFIAGLGIVQPAIFNQLVKRYGVQTPTMLAVGHGMEQAGSNLDQASYEEARLFPSLFASVASAPTSGYTATTFTINASDIYPASTGNGPVRLGDRVSFAEKGITGVVTATAANNTFQVTPDRAWTFTSAYNNASQKVVIYTREVTEGYDGANTPTLTPRVATFTYPLSEYQDAHEATSLALTTKLWFEIDTEGGTKHAWAYKGMDEMLIRQKSYEDLGYVFGKTPDSTTLGTGGAGYRGQIGMLQAIETYGNTVDTGGFDATLSDFRQLTRNFDKYGNAMNYCMYVGNTLDYQIDDMVSASSSGTAAAKFGQYQNAENMDVVFAFNGFKVGSYNFVKTAYNAFNNPDLFGYEGSQYAKYGIMLPCAGKDAKAGIVKNLEGMNVPPIKLNYMALDGLDLRYLMTWVGALPPAKNNQKATLTLDVKRTSGVQYFGVNSFGLLKTA